MHAVASNLILSQIFLMRSFVAFWARIFVKANFLFCFSFRQLKETYNTNMTKEFFMKVLPHNGVNIVCPNDMAVNDWLGNQLPDRMYENMWMVDKHGYDNCMVNDKTNPTMNKQILRCDDPNIIKYKTFELYNEYSTEEPMFAPGHHYYFICKYTHTHRHTHTYIYIYR